MRHEPALDAPFEALFAPLEEVRVTMPDRPLHQCFGCGPHHDIGLRVRTFRSGDEVLSPIVIPRRFEGPPQGAHGGIVAAYLDEVLVSLIDRITRRLRAARRVARTIILRLRFDDFTRATRSLTLPRLTDQSQAILAAARTLLTSARPLIERRGITLVGLSLTNLESADRVQLCLMDDWRPEALDAALDEVRDRYGSKSITRGVLVGRDPGIAMPLLPD